MNPDCMPINAPRDIEEYFLEREKRYTPVNDWLSEDEYKWVEEFKIVYGYDPYQNQYEKKAKRPTTPKEGHLVRFPADVDLIPQGTTGIIVDTRGVMIQVMMPDNNMEWIRRDLVEVIE